MCLILLAIGQHPDLPLVVAANRDEFYTRPTRGAEAWPEAPELIAGRDLQQGGTWFGITRRGRLAMVTNVRQPGERHGGASRGLLVRDYLLDAATAPETGLRRLLADGNRYAGFNLIAGTIDRLFFASNRGARPPVPLGPGVHGLSNASLDTPWPKVAEGRRELAGLLKSHPAAKLEPALFGLLADEHRAPDAELPKTGIGLEWERLLSARFIRGDGYGTRSSTVLTLDSRGQVRFIERTFNGRREPEDERRFEWRLATATTVG